MNFSGIDELSLSCAQGFNQVSHSITTFKLEHVEPAKTKAIQRYQNTETIKGALLAASGTVGVTGAIGTGALVASPVLGGVGALVIGSIAFPPAAIITGAIAVGLIGLGALGCGILKFLNKYRTHQTRAIKTLEYLAKLCDDINSDAVKMVENSNKLSQHADDLFAKLKCLTFSLQSEKQRRMHAQACAQIRNANQTLTDTLNSIIEFKFESLNEIEDTLSMSGIQAITSATP